MSGLQSLVTLAFNVHGGEFVQISIINHTLPSTIRGVIGTFTGTSMASNSTSDSECYLAVQVPVKVTITPNCTRNKVCD